MDGFDPKEPRHAPGPERDRPESRDPRTPEPASADRHEDDDSDGYRYTDWASI
jgi:hypothetical protein